MENIINSSFLGLAIGDALGVPVEFELREYLEQDPVLNMREYGTHDQPLGTFSDDASMTFCTVESLIQGYDPKDIATKFLNWLDVGYWSAHGEVFDIGIATSQALENFRLINDPYTSGEFTERSNGNGSLMRMLPIAFYVAKLDIEERFRVVKEVSSITHAHIRSVIGCFYYTEFIRHLLNRVDKNEAYELLQISFKDELNDIESEEISKYKNLLEEDIATFNSNKISSSGYIVSSLEAAIWCILTTDNFKDAVLKAVNLGNDTDTIGAITGSIAGILYPNEIPQEWINQLVRNEDIIDLAERFAESIK